MVYEHSRQHETGGSNLKGPCPFNFCLQTTTIELNLFCVLVVREFKNSIWKIHVFPKTKWLLLWIIHRPFLRNFNRDYSSEIQVKTFDHSNHICMTSYH